MKILVTGAAGFIASHLVDRLLDAGCEVVGLDVLTYAGNLDNLAEARKNPRFTFLHGDICAVRPALLEGVDRIVHAAAESHVDRSIESPWPFVRTNVLGTFILLEQCRVSKWPGVFVHLSTDEVYGELGPVGQFTESSRYAPNSPYSATKAASDHLVRSYAHTFGLRQIVVNCSNNYGPRQFPEKLIPKTIVSALRWEPITVHGNGLNVRDWLHVYDCVRALELVTVMGIPGETYNVGGGCEQTNIDVVKQLCAVLDELRPESAPFSRLITYTEDRPGNDKRYSVDFSALTARLGWTPEIGFAAGLRQTVEWYLNRGAGNQSQKQPVDDPAEQAAHRKPENRVAYPA